MPPSVYILHGEDSFSIAKEIQSFRQRLGDPATVSLNMTEFDGRTVTLADLRSAADTIPFLAGRRLVIVTGLLSRLHAKGGDADASEQESTPAALRDYRDSLLQYLPGVPPTTALVFVESGNLPERSKFLNLIARIGDIGYARRFDPPDEGELPGWILQRAKSHGGTFTRPAAQALAAAVGGELRLLDHEIEKLLAYVDRARPVDVADVETLTPYTGEVEIFDVVDAMGERRGRDAVRLLMRLLERPGQHPLPAFAMICRQFRLLLQARELIDDGAAAASVAPLLGLRPFVAAKMLEQSRNFSMTELEDTYRRLLDIDVAIKSSQIDAELALVTFVADPLGWSS